MKQPNPLLEDFTTPPFHLIKNEHYLPAFKAAMAAAKSDIKKIKEQPDAPNFNNTIAALDYSGKQLSRVSSIFFNLNAAETNPEMQQIAQEISPLLSAFNNDLSLDPDLFARVLEVQKQKNALALDKESERLLDKTYKSFVRNGAQLSAEKKEELREIDGRLSSLQLSFGEHVLADSNAFEMHLTEQEYLDGLPESVVQAAAELAKSKDKKRMVDKSLLPKLCAFHEIL